MLPFLAPQVLRCPLAGENPDTHSSLRLGVFSRCWPAAYETAGQRFITPFSFFLDANWTALRWFALASLCTNVTGSRDSVSARLSHNDGTCMCHSLLPLCFPVMPRAYRKVPTVSQYSGDLFFSCFTRSYSSSSPSPSPLSVGIAPCSFTRLNLALPYLLQSAGST